MLYGVTMVMFHREFLYPFRSDAFALPGYRQVAIPVVGDDPVTVQIYDGPRGAPVVLFLMGNLGSLQIHRSFLNQHRASGATIVAMTYRGGGGETGRASERVLKRDAEAVVNALPSLVPQAGARVVHGYSLGTGLAMHVAAKFELDGVVLSAPYDRICHVMTLASLLPACILPVDRWNSLGLADDVSEPVLVVHGAKDYVVPAFYGDNLVAHLTHSHVQHVVIEQAGHNDLLSYAQHNDGIAQFIRTLRADSARVSLQ